MKICVFGLWHLGTVTAACLANAGFQVVGLDFDQETINSLQRGGAPIHEPGLNELISANLLKGKLEFSTDPEVALAGVDVLWVAFDTPVDNEDRADDEFVAQKLISVMDKLKSGTRVIISSQVPVGFTRRMEEVYTSLYPDKDVIFAYSPENLRLGKAIQVFENPDRIVIGIRKNSDRILLQSLFSILSDRLEWMVTESAEMTKHAINAFLATSVTFANELATICEQVGADAKEVERGLKSEERIGPKAYLGPGYAFAGGTLGRDINLLIKIGEKCNLPTHLIKAVKNSNDYHKTWVQRKVVESMGDLKGKKVAVLGLTYKPGTDTLRRSWSIELCHWLSQQGACLQAFDPQVKELPNELNNIIVLSSNIKEALNEAECAVVGTQWEMFRDELTQDILNVMNRQILIDANGFLEKNFAGCNEIKYIVIGRGVT